MKRMESYVMPIYQFESPEQREEEIDDAIDRSEKVKQQVEAEIRKRVRGLTVIVRSSTDPWHVEVEITDGWAHAANRLNLEVVASGDLRYYDNFAIVLIRSFALQAYFIREQDRK